MEAINDTFDLQDSHLVRTLLNPICQVYRSRDALQSFL
jgi:hypothetical protein